MLRPYRARALHDPDDAVDVVGHDDELVEADGRETAREFMPGVRDDFADEAIEEEDFSVVGADSNEVGACIGVVVCREADGASVVDSRLVLHGRDASR